MEAELIKAVHTRHPQYTIIATGAEGSIIDGLLQLADVPNDNVIYAFHYYVPHSFTEPSNSAEEHLRYPSGIASTNKAIAQLSKNDPIERYHLSQYGFEHWSKKRLDSQIQQACDWVRNLSQSKESPNNCEHLALICDEFGVSRMNLNRRDRARWISDVRVSLQKQGIGWTFWDFRDCSPGEQCLHDHFGLFDNKAGIDVDIAKALHVHKKGLIGIQHH